jgi:hypothetical protein
VQAPSTHTCVLSQAMPQPPQLVGSVSVSIQALPHRANPLAHVKPQAPSLHSARAFEGASQATPQPPQCAGSAAVSTHVSPHGANPASQAKPHAPALHVA